MPGQLLQAVALVHPQGHDLQVQGRALGDEKRLPGQKGQRLLLLGPVGIEDMELVGLAGVAFHIAVQILLGHVTAADDGGQALTAVPLTPLQLPGAVVDAIVHLRENLDHGVQRPEQLIEPPVLGIGESPAGQCLAGFQVDYLCAGAGDGVADHRQLSGQIGELCHKSPGAEGHLNPTVRGPLERRGRRRCQLAVTVEQRAVDINADQSDVHTRSSLFSRFTDSVAGFGEKCKNPRRTAMGMRINSRFPPGRGCGTLEKRRDCHGFMSDCQCRRHCHRG